MYKIIEPTISVITVTYNAADTLEATLRSVAAQTYKKVEYILVDGASTDGTLDLVEKYRPYINKVVSEPDRGLYDAMNKGLALATGDYVCFLNAGDTFHEDCTLEMVSLAPPFFQPLPDVIYGDTAIVDDQRRFVRMRRLAPPDRLTWKSFRQGMLVCHQAFFARRELAEPFDLQYRYSADFDWCIRVMKQSDSLVNTYLTLIDYLQEGMTTRHHRASLWERFRIMTEHYGLASTVLHHLWFAVRAIVKR